MEITGRLTQDAQVKNVDDSRKVVNFTLAVNEYYKSKGEKRTEAVFYNCSYWVSDAVAQHLTKGSIIQVFGSLNVSAYIDMQGEAQAVLRMHVGNIKIISAKKNKAEGAPALQEGTGGTDDLPF